jgi:4-hydroxy-2-oxoheptanedioate aldolase
MRENSVKRLLAAGRPALGTWVTLGSPLAAEWLAQLGWDWIIVDQEHGAIDTADLLGLLQAISTTPSVPLVRVPWADPQAIKRALDVGAYGLMLPMVESREQAEQCVRAMKYPPAGQRSYGGTRRTLYGGPDYNDHANEQVLVIPMIESIAGVAHVDDILSVPGVDACFVGPNDLAASLGLPPSLNPRGAAYDEALARILDACRRHGVAPGIQTEDAAAANARLEQGWRLVGVGGDGRFMATTALRELRAIRR